MITAALAPQPGGRGFRPASTETLLASRDAQVADRPLGSRCRRARAKRPRCRRRRSRREAAAWAGRQADTHRANTTSCPARRGSPPRRPSPGFGDQPGRLRSVARAALRDPQAAPLLAPIDLAASTERSTPTSARARRPRRSQCCNRPGGGARRSAGDDRFVTRPSENATWGERWPSVGRNDGRGWGESWPPTAVCGLSGRADGPVAVELEQVVRRGN